MHIRICDMLLDQLKAMERTVLVQPPRFSCSVKRSLDSKRARAEGELKQRVREYLRGYRDALKKQDASDAVDKDLALLRAIDPDEVILPIAEFSPEEVLPCFEAYCISELDAYAEALIESGEYQPDRARELLQEAISDIIGRIGPSRPHDDWDQSLRLAFDEKLPIMPFEDDWWLDDDTDDVWDAIDEIEMCGQDGFVPKDDPDVDGLWEEAFRSGWTAVRSLRNDPVHRFEYVLRTPINLDHLVRRLATILEVQVLLCIDKCHNSWLRAQTGLERESTDKRSTGLERPPFEDCRNQVSMVLSDLVEFGFRKIDMCGAFGIEDFHTLRKYQKGEIKRPSEKFMRVYRRVESQAAVNKLKEELSEHGKSACASSAGIRSSSSHPSVPVPQVKEKKLNTNPLSASETF